MLFRTTEHYSYSEEYDNLGHECLICLSDISCDFIINKYNFNCECYKLVHENCLKEWYEINKKCPICRIHPIKRSSNIYLFEIIKTFIKILLIFETLMKFLLFLCVLSFINTMFCVIINFIELK